MNRREWIGATAGMLITLPNGVSIAECQPSGDEPVLLGSHPMWIGCGSDNYYLEWIRSVQPKDEDRWYWSWRERTNDDAWFVGECMTSEPHIDILGGKLRVSVANGLEFIWNG